jgi:anthranilate synthase component 2
VSIAEIDALAPERIVVSPGPCTPHEAGISVDLIRHVAGRVPVLGVCLGHQALGAAFGARIVRAPTLMHGKLSAILHDEHGVFAGLPQGFMATRYHSLIVDRDTLPDCFEVSAETADGLIMGLRHRDYPLEGVQFHPEAILTEHGHALLTNFLALPISEVKPKFEGQCLTATMRQ